MSERAKHIESTNVGERAKKTVSTIVPERATSHESTEERERAHEYESTTVEERAVDDERTKNTERASADESTKERERANPSESTKTAELQIPRGAMREYLIVVGITAIYVARLPTTSGFIGVSRDLHLSEIGLRRRFPGAEISAVWWCRNRERADTIRREVHARFLPPSTESIVEMAKQLDIGITAHTTVMRRVAFITEIIERKIEEARHNGDLRGFHTAFRHWRLKARMQDRVMTYSEAKARLRRHVMQRLVNRRSDEGGELPWSALFPTLEH